MRNNNSFFRKKGLWSQKGGKFSLGCPTLTKLFLTLSFLFVFVQKEKKSKESIRIRLLKEI